MWCIITLEWTISMVVMPYYTYRSNPLSTGAFTSTFQISQAIYHSQSQARTANHNKNPNICMVTNVRWATTNSSNYQDHNINEMNTGHSFVIFANITNMAVGLIRRLVGYYGPTNNIVDSARGIANNVSNKHVFISVNALRYNSVSIFNLLSSNDELYMGMA